MAAPSIAPPPEHPEPHPEPAAATLDAPAAARETAPDDGGPARPSEPLSPGEAAAVTREICARHAKLLRRLTEPADVSPESARDVRQRVREVLAEQIQKHGRPDSEPALIRRIAARANANARRARRHRPVADGGASAELAVSTEPGPEAWAFARELAWIAPHILSEMTPDAAEILRLSIQGLTCADIAALQHRKVEVVWAQISRARKRFRALARELYDLDLEDPR